MRYYCFEKDQKMLHGLSGADLDLLLGKQE